MPSAVDSRVRARTLGGRARPVGVVAALLFLLLVAGIGRPDLSRTEAALQRDPIAELDRVLDLYVRDGLVYYSALRTERATLDRFLDSVRDEPPGFNGWPEEEAKAFWLNAYNTIVLRTVLEHYPIRGTSPDYPANSIRQVSGVFDRQEHQVAGRSVTLDAIETTVLGALADPRLFLALGRGSVDSGRLRSESYRGRRLAEQLDDVVQEFATTPRHVELDRLGRRVRVSAIFGWRETEFVTAFADRGWLDSGRTPLERAILNLITPRLFPSELSFLEANDFTLQYQEFDWRLNDLTGGRPSNR